MYSSLFSSEGEWWSAFASYTGLMEDFVCVGIYNKFFIKRKIKYNGKILDN